MGRKLHFPDCSPRYFINPRDKSGWEGGITGDEAAEAEKASSWEGIKVFVAGQGAEGSLIIKTEKKGASLGSVAWAVLLVAPPN